MVRVLLNYTNNTGTYSPLTFSSSGNLLAPIFASHMNVVKFSVPNSGIPFLNFVPNRYQVQITYDGTSPAPTPVTWVSRGAVLADLQGIQYPVYEIDHLLYMINQALAQAMATLVALVPPLPTMTAPYLTYDNVNGVYSLIVNTAGFRTDQTTPIYINFNDSLFQILQSLPVQYLSATDQFQMIVNPTVENTYLTTYTKLTQEGSTFSNYASPRFLTITTSMPVQTEISTSQYAGREPENKAIIQQFTIDYSEGSKVFWTNNDFSTVENFYRSSKLTKTAIYNIQCAITYVVTTGESYPFIIPPFQSAVLELEFFDVDEIRGLVTGLGGSGSSNASNFGLGSQLGLHR